MAYEPQQWQDFPSTATPKSAARLTHMETGIKGAHDLADEALSRSGTSESARITDATAIGRAMLTTASQASARAVIGAGTGTVKSVNGATPDATGRVDVGLPDLAQIDAMQAVLDIFEAGQDVNDATMAGVAADDDSTFRQTLTRTGSRPVGRDEQAIDLTDHTVGDGVADDTAGMLAAIARAVARQVPLFSPPGRTYLVGPLTINARMTWLGDFNFKARTQDQPHVLYVNSQYNDFTSANIYIDGAGRALYGVRGQAFARTKFGSLECRNNQIWGFQFNRTGNNNMVVGNFFTGRGNGQRYVVTATMTAATANINSSLSGYGTFTLSQAIPAKHIVADSAYFAVSGGLAYEIRTLGDGSTVEIYNLNPGISNTVEVTILIGGALNIPQHGDSGVGSWGALDIIGNPGIGVQNNSLYGHAFNNMVMQHNGIGFACATYTKQASFTRPYFEGNLVDYVSRNYVEGVMTAPLLDDLTKMQNLARRLTGYPAGDPRLIVLQNYQPSLLSDTHPADGPSAGLLRPGQMYAHHRTTGGNFPTFTIDNTQVVTVAGTYFVIMSLSSQGAAPSTVTFALADTATHTIMGGTAPYAARVNGRALFVWKLVRSGGGTLDWKVDEFYNDVRTAISQAPARLGQLAVVSGVGYIATGTASTADWKPITA